MDSIESARSFIDVFVVCQCGRRNESGLGPVKRIRRSLTPRCHRRRRRYPVTAATVFPVKKKQKNRSHSLVISYLPYPPDRN